jgi:hypothetical protein
MTELWPSMYGPGLDWIERTEAAIVALDHPKQGAMMAITNAIEYQFEIGACTETIGHLLAAMIAQANSLGMPLQQLGLDRSPEELREGLRPTGHQTR